MERCRLKEVVASLLLLLMPFVSYAIPAYTGNQAMPQPDGTTIIVRMFGDELSHWCTSEDGYLLKKNSDGFYYYATVDGNGSVIATSLKAVDVIRRTQLDKDLLTTLPSGAELQKQLQRVCKASVSKSRLKAKKRTAGQMSFPCYGKRKALAILVDFPAVGNSEAVKFHYENPQSLFSRMLNEEGFDFDGATGSVRDYFLDSSDGAFDLSFDVYGPVTLANSVGYYGNDGEALAWKMVVEACSALKDEINFGQYDQDGDGVIDNVYVFYAGENEPDTNVSSLVWPHAANIDELEPGSDYSFGGYHLNHYACSNEISVKYDEFTHEKHSYFAGIGNVCHEFSHVLGLPDLYNVLDQTVSFTPNSWSVMDVGSYNNLCRTPPAYSSFERLSLKWIEPYELGKAENISLLPIADGGACKISTPNQNEYFLLENRQQEGWDKYLPGHGMLIWHIAYDATAWANNVVNVNHDNQRVDLEEADDYRSYDSFDGDAFPGTKGITSFTDDTSPNSRTMLGNKPCGVPITDIKETADGEITFKVCGGYSEVATPANLLAEQVTPVSFVATWDGVLEASCYAVSAWKVLDDGEKAALADWQEKIVGEHSVTIDELQPEHTYCFCIQSVDAEGKMSAPSVLCYVTMPMATFAYIPPEILPFTDVNSTSFTMNWEALEGADSYLVNVCALHQGEPSYITADFAGGIASLPLGWATNSTMTISTSGNYGEAAPAISLSSNNSFVETPTTIETVRGLDFWYRQRNNPSEGNSIVISALSGDGKDYEEIDRIGLAGTLVAGQTYSLPAEKIPSNTKSFRITYYLQGKGALAIDDIRYYYGDNYVGSDSVSVETTKTFYTFTDKQPNTKYLCKVRGKNSEAVTIDNSSSVITLGEEASVDMVASSEALGLTIRNGVLSVTATSRGIMVCDVFGRIVAELPASAAIRSVALPTRGLYIVSDGMHTKKIVW